MVGTGVEEVEEVLRIDRLARLVQRAPVRRAVNAVPWLIAAGEDPRQRPRETLRHGYLRRFERMYAIQALVPGFGFRFEPARRFFFVVEVARRARRFPRRRPVDLDLMPPTATACAAV